MERNDGRRKKPPVVELEVENIQARAAYKDKAFDLLKNGGLLTTRGRLLKDRNERLMLGEFLLELQPDTIQTLGYYEAEGNIRIVVGDEIGLGKRITTALTALGIHYYKINESKSQHDLPAKKLAPTLLKQWAREYGHGQIPAPQPKKTK